jgi:protein-S-isoprenylcysteine O-methyltransferase Ste14
MSNQPKVLTPRIIIQVLLFIVVVPFLPLLISRNWGWGEAWVYALVNILGFAVSRALAARAHPDVIRERAHFGEHENTKSWDKVLSPLVGMGSATIPLVAGLQALLDPSIAFGSTAKIVALLLIVAGYVLASYALIENRFFSGTVRIQSERGHHVISTGPYAWVRHPGYAGSFWAFLATPVLLDSRWAFVPAVVILCALVIRTHLEDDTLQEELPGYRDYAARVRYRLIPGVW